MRNKRANVDTSVDKCRQSLPPCTQAEAEAEAEVDKKKKKGRFAPPSLEEVKNYIQEKHYSVKPESFIAHYESNGWKVGRNPMKSWKAACVTFEKNRGNFTTAQPKEKDPSLWNGQPMYDLMAPKD